MEPENPTTEKKANRKWAVIAAGLATALLAYAGLSAKWAGIFSSLKKMASAIPFHSQEAAQLNPAQAQGDASSQPTQKEQMIRDQEKIAKSIAQQQALAQQSQQQTQASLSEVQKTLQSIEEINRLNRQNQQLQQQTRTSR